ncbi:MAG: hypothetical protein NC308_02445 [Clostridium sp.]|nr:hypothetical protein [Bacteroides sp.]MCM1197723.1 hypothetical protein [Clostridium sp.]
MRTLRIFIMLAALVVFAACSVGPKGDTIGLSQDKVTMSSDAGEALVSAKSIELSHISVLSATGDWQVVDGSLIIDNDEKYLSHDWIESRKIVDASGRLYLKIVVAPNPTGTERSCLVWVSNGVGDQMDNVLVKQE